MPDPVSEPRYHQQGSSLDKGASSHFAQGDSFASQAEVFGANQQPQPEDAAIFAPTDFPNRPITYGAPIGAGPNHVTPPRLSERALLDRAASRFLEDAAGVPDSVLIWAMRVLAGE